MKRMNGDLIYLVFSHHQIFNVIDWTRILFCSAHHHTALLWIFWLIHKFVNKRFTFRSLNQVFCFYFEAKKNCCCAIHVCLKLLIYSRIFFGSYFVAGWKFRKAFSTAIKIGKKILELETGRVWNEMWETRTSRKIGLEINHKTAKITNF
jgi:hypothetical protein